MTNRNRWQTFLHIYKSGHASRKTYTRPGFRLAIALLTIIFMMLIWAYLSSRYDYLVNPIDGASFLLDEKLLYWFMAGLLCGAFLAHITNEAEYFYSIWKLAGHLEKDFEKTLTRDVQMTERALCMPIHNAKTVKTGKKPPKRPPGRKR